MSVKPVYIIRTGSFLPNAPVANDAMETLLGQVGERPSRSRKMVLRSNQIHTRYYAIDPNTGEFNYTNAQLCAAAVRQLEGDGFSLQELTCLAAATSIADQIMPGHGSMVHGELDAPVCEVISTAGVCASGMSALKYAWLNVATGLHAQAVAAASEAASYAMKAENFEPELADKVAALETHPEIAFEKDFLRWMLSDGAGAFLLSGTAPQDNALALRIEWIDIFSYASEMPVCMYAGARKEADGSLTGWQAVDRQTCNTQSFLSVKQDVKLLNEQIITYTAEKPLAQIKQKYGLAPEDIDYFLPHYSSGYFRDRLAAGMERAGFAVDMSRWFTNLSSKGNTGAASMYIMLDELIHSGRLQRGEKILCYVPESGRFTVAYMLLEVV